MLLTSVDVVVATHAAVHLGASTVALLTVMSTPSSVALLAIAATNKVVLMELWVMTGLLLPAGKLITKAHFTAPAKRRELSERRLSAVTDVTLTISFVTSKLDAAIE